MSQNASEPAMGLIGNPLLQSFTQSAAQIIDLQISVNPLNNWFFTSASSLFIVLLGWYITDKIIEPRLDAVFIGLLSAWFTFRIASQLPLRLIRQQLKISCELSC